ncbi:unnamed protein product [Ostreobium quekettii]|uniref:Uncharacterized protein n=1 Tax=Ostreobium quekettii TaxID=121088 RepID=A0A8S1IX78_9CHLO|nr:unnamed protein product [Ostreobium quekettii]|eukprot:evm.model.scf_346.3 EVM.evm.TU.scf_346.3   scf_346:35383-36138(+)
MPAIPSYREVGDRPRRCPPAADPPVAPGLAMRPSLLPRRPTPPASAPPVDMMRLLPLDLAEDKETWLCAPGRGPEVDSWPVDLGDDQLSSDASESVSSVSVECDEMERLDVGNDADGQHGGGFADHAGRARANPEPPPRSPPNRNPGPGQGGASSFRAGARDAGEWDGRHGEVEEVQLLFPIDCSSDDMVWLLGGAERRARGRAGSNVDVLFPAGCSDTDKDWLTRAGSLSEMDWLVPAGEAQKIAPQVSF